MKQMFPCEAISGNRTLKSPRRIRWIIGVGDTVRHVKFGVGIVKDIVEGGRDYEVTVDFDRFGTKKMFAAFAKLKKI